MTVFIEVSGLLILLFVILFAGSQVSTFVGERTDNGWLVVLSYALSVILMPLMLLATAYLYFMMLESVFERLLDHIGVVRGWSLLGFAFLYLGFICYAFGHKYETKRGKADKRYKDNPQNDPELGAYLVLTVIWTITLIVSAYNNFWGWFG
ncbi:hypothetical protein JFL47_07385 [Haemophilus haemoglobinophilus]|nr:hypothetical protein [Canicola haemoglobinophilus]